MDNSDRTESGDPFVSIPDHLLPPIIEWIVEEVRQACEDTRSDKQFDRVVEAVQVRQAVTAESLTPKQTVDLAECAARWQEAVWPRSLAEVDDVEERLAITRGLLEVRDRARAAVREQAERAIEQERKDATSDTGVAQDDEPTQ